MTKRGRPSKAYQEELRKAEEMRRLHEDESDFERTTLQTMHRLQKEKVKASNQLSVSKPKVPKKVVVEDEEPGEDDTVKLTPAQRKAESKKKASRLTLINLIEKLAVAASEVGDPEDIKAHLTEDDTIDPETISELQKNCMILKTSLKHLGSIADTPNVAVPSTSSHYGNYIVYRPPNQDLLYLLSVAEVFKPNHQAYGNRKTLAFVRQRGTQFPLTCALSGWTNVLDYHPRMLDTEFWLDEVKNFAANQLDYVFKAGCWDRAKGREDGDGYASHVELTLMLFYTCHLVAKKLGIKTSIRKASRSIWKLKMLKEKFEAEIVISKAPCGYCKQFQTLFQNFSGVRFTYIIMDNVAEVFPMKDLKGYEYYPQFADDENNEEMLEALSLMIEYGVTPRKSGSRIAIEIPSERSPTQKVAHRPKAKVYKPTPQIQAPNWHYQDSEPSSTANNNQREQARQSSPMYSEVVTTKTVQKRRIQSFTYEDPNKSINLDTSDDDEYVPDTQISTQKVYSSESKTPPNRATSYAPPTPNSGAFGLEARQRAQEIRNKKKHKREAPETGPSSKASKKQRWNHPDYHIAE